MHKIERHARWAIIEWIIQQEKFARSMLTRANQTQSQSRAAGILLFARMMRIALERYEEPGEKRGEILRDLIERWKKAHPGQSELPRNVLFDLGMEASRRAFEERYPDLARFSEEIATMRTELETVPARVSELVPTRAG